MSNVKKLFAVIFAVMAVMLMSTAVFAYTGSGTEDDPYIITDYAEFAELSQSKIGYTKFTYYKLGADISSEDNMNDTMQITIGEARDRASYMHLDLNGHNIFRKAKTTDKGLFVVNSGKLIIEDSVGTSTVNSYMTDGTNYAPVFYVNYMFLNMELSASLTINGGTYNNQYTQLPCLIAGNINGDLIINNGVFCSAVIINNYNLGKGVPTNFYVNGGKFKQIDSSDSVGETCIKDCTISESLFVSNKFLEEVIYSSSVVTQNGTELTTLPKQELTGTIVITDPNKPVITTQPTNLNIGYIGNTATFAVSGTNIQSRQWHLIDPSGKEVTFDSIKEKGYGKLASDSMTTSSTLQIVQCMPELTGYKVYCDVSGNGYTLKTNTAEINVAKKVNFIYADIENFENAVHGHNTDEFLKVTTTPDSFSDASDAKWYLGFDVPKLVSDTTIFLNEKYTIRLEFDIKDGYEFTDSPVCYIGNVKGETVRAVRVTGSSTSTHQVFLLEYIVPAPEGGIHIDATMARTLTAPAVGETPAIYLDSSQKFRYENYTNRVTWSPADTTFQNGKVYSAQITLTPKEHYYFDENSVITINGKVRPFTIDSNGNAVVVLAFTDAGDVELDGDVDKVDAALLLKHISGIEKLTPAQYSAAFVNDDTNVDMLDVIAILNK